MLAQAIGHRPSATGQRPQACLIGELMWLESNAKGHRVRLNVGGVSYHGGNTVLKGRLRSHGIP